MYKYFLVSKNTKLGIELNNLKNISNEYTLFKIKYKILKIVKRGDKFLGINLVKFSPFDNIDTYGWQKVGGILNTYIPDLSTDIGKQIDNEISCLKQVTNSEVFNMIDDKALITKVSIFSNDQFFGLLIFFKNKISNPNLLNEIGYKEFCYNFPVFNKIYGDERS